MDNQTKVTIDYLDLNNKTAKIQAIIEDETVTKVSLLNGMNWIYIALLSLVVVLLIFLIIYRRTKNIEIPDQKPEKPFDYRSEALQLLGEARSLFEKEKFKDAYSKASQAIRVYYSFKHGLNKEITNTDIIKFLKKFCF